MTTSFVLPSWARGERGDVGERGESTTGERGERGEWGCVASTSIFTSSVPPSGAPGPADDTIRPTQPDVRIR